MDIEQALKHWQDQKLLTAKKADELRAALPGASNQMQNRAIGIFTAIGAILMGLGVILFVGSHWQEIPSAIRMGMLLAATLGSGYAGYHLAYVKGMEKTGMGLLFLNILVYGASIFLAAQIYHLPLNFWWAGLLWFLGTVYFGYTLQSRMHVWLSVPLFLLTIGWLRTSFSSAGELDFLFTERSSIFPLLGFIGLGLIGKSILQQTYASTRFASNTLFHWGLFLVLFLIVLTTVDKTLFFQFLRYPFDALGILILAASVLTILLAMFMGGFETSQGKGGLIALLLYLLFVTVLAYVPQWMGFIPGVDSQQYWYSMDAPIFLGLHVIHILLVFAFCLTVIWFGTLMHRPAVINLGMIAVAIAIFIQYFSWAFDLLPRSFAFILGGALILGLGFALERQRKRLVTAAIQ